MHLNKRGFTLVELLVVVGMIAVIMGAVTTSVSGSRERARVQKASAEVKAISQAILAYENYDQGGDKFELPEMEKADAEKGTIGFLLGEGAVQSGGKIPVLLMASLSGGGKMMDPWNTPYKITIKRTSVSPRVKVLKNSMQTGYFLPNNYRLSEDER